MFVCLFEKLFDFLFFFFLIVFVLRLIDPTLFDNFPHASIVFATIFIVKSGGFGIGRRSRIGIAQERLDGRQYGRNIINRGPLILQNIQADLSVIVNVRMEHLGQESDLRCLVRIIFREFEHEFEGSTLPRSIVRSKNDGLPQHNVRVHRSTRHTRRRVILQSKLQNKTKENKQNHNEQKHL